MLNAANAGSQRPDDALWVTEVSGCLLRSFLQRLFPRPVEDVGQAARMLAGDALHRTVLPLVAKSVRGCRGEVEREVVVPIDGFDVRGRADLVLECGGERYVVELKTMYSKPARLDEPMPPHVRQLQYYMNALGAPRGAVVYIDVQRGGVKAFELERDPGYMTELRSRARALWRALEALRPPRPERAPYNCHGCPFYFDCVSGKYREMVETLRRRRHTQQGAGGGEGKGYSRGGRRFRGAGGWGRRSSRSSR